MIEGYQIVQRAEPAWDIIGAGIRSHNLQHGGEDGAQTLCFVLQDEAWEVIGGVIGQTFWDWLHIHLIWLPEALRGQCFGGRLLEAIEEPAKRTGAHHAYLDTYSFQAPDFYEKHGYRVFGTLADYPQGHQLYFMRKDFQAD